MWYHNARRDISCIVYLSRRSMPSVHPCMQESQTGGLFNGSLYDMLPVMESNPANVYTLSWNIALKKRRGHTKHDVHTGLGRATHRRKSNTQEEERHSVALDGELRESAGQIKRDTCLSWQGSGQRRSWGCASHLFPSSLLLPTTSLAAIAPGFINMNPSSASTTPESISARCDTFRARASGSLGSVWTSAAHVLAPVDIQYGGGGAYCARTERSCTVGADGWQRGAQARRAGAGRRGTSALAGRAGGGGNMLVTMGKAASALITLRLTSRHVANYFTTHTKLIAVRSSKGLIQHKE
ncbi:hypothetical protein GGX14DRAFT_545731 [Mycena pura]|uniref:Uncharacterized protein n=1 Tax=Mycena pura TaxID=153505 RepID=A0AAD6V3E0_9AGAR|nr:hypothetical protein GGX14DRAFT_545731 [Mycena pura]